MATDSSGGIWVAEGNEGLLKKYSPAGVLLDTISVGGEPCDLAIDSADNIYVSFFFGSTKKYTAASDYATSTEVDPATAFAIAVDQSTDELYVVHFNHVSVYEADGTFLYEFSTSEGGFGGVAIDEATEEVYVSDYEHFTIQVFGPPVSLPKLTTEGADGISGTGAGVHGTINPKDMAVEDCHFEAVPASQFNLSQYSNVSPDEKYPCVPAAASIPADSNPHAVSASLSGLDPATIYHYRLVATNAVGEAKGIDRTFTTAGAAPLIREQSVEAIGTGDATLAAEVNPRGADTTYHVEYGTTNAYGQSTAESASFGFSSDDSFRSVSVHIGGLQIGTAYHFRFVATNSAGSTEGTDTSFATYPTSPSLGSCPNVQFRIGVGTRLPDCRAYEQATPIEKHGSNAQGKIGEVNTSNSGDRVTFFANGGLPVSGGNSSLVPFVASRGPSGWGTDGILPPTEPGDIGEVLGWDEDLSTTLVSANGPGNVGRALYLRDSETATFQLGPATAAPNLFAGFAGFAADTSHYLFATSVQLLPSATAGKVNLYEFDHGTLTLVGRIPAGPATTCDDEAGPACVPTPNDSRTLATAPAISDDGSRVVFVTPSEGGERQIYLREDGAKTTRISVSQRTTPDPNGAKPATLLSVTRDGSKVLFMSCEKLTDDSTAFSTGEDSCDHNVMGEENDQGQDLYSYDVGSGELSDLTVDSNVGDPKGAEVQGILGTSPDDSYVYFAANGVLAPGASHGNCKFGLSAVNGECSLYVYHDGTTTFIARLNKQAGAPDWEERTGSRVSANGVLLFQADQSLTGYNNQSAGCASFGGLGPCTELFRYSASDEELTCVSCMPTQTPPSRSARYGTGGDFFSKASGGFTPRNLSADGNRVFFESPDALIAADTNGVFDVYEWEAKGSGSCESESQNGGCLYLISSGTSSEPAQFLDASANGDHVFFFTEQQLVPSDKDRLFDVYDAGVGAGLTSQHTLAPPSCSSTACQANPAPPADQTPASAAFSGPGNAHQRPSARKCPKGKRKVRSAGKVRCQKVRKQHKRHNNRGGAK